MAFALAFYLAGVCRLLGPLCPRELAELHLDAVALWILVEETSE